MRKNAEAVVVPPPPAILYLCLLHLQKDHQSHDSTHPSTEVGILSSFIADGGDKTHFPRRNWIFLHSWHSIPFVYRSNWGAFLVSVSKPSGTPHLHSTHAIPQLFHWVEVTYRYTGLCFYIYIYI